MLQDLAKKVESPRELRLENILKQCPHFDEEYYITKRDTRIQQKIKMAMSSGKGLIGDGAPWIWNLCKEIFPSAKEILDYYHCSEYVHGVANAHYGKETRESRQWCEATLTRIYYDCHEDVLGSFGKMKAQNQEVQDKIDTFYNYLANHGER